MSEQMIRTHLENYDCTLLIDMKFEKKLDKIFEAVKDAIKTVGYSADEIYILRKRGFSKAARRYAKFNFSSPTVVATTEIRKKNGTIETSTFVNASNSFVRRNLDAVLAHEFAHIKHHISGHVFPNLRFKKRCPKEAKQFAHIFLMVIEEILADSILPASKRNKKNKAILKALKKENRLPHPLFLLQLKTTTKLSPEEKEELEELIQKSIQALRTPSPIPFYTIEQLYQRIFEQKELKPTDLQIIEDMINLLIDKLYGIKNACKFIINQ